MDVKGRFVFNGKQQREWLSKEDKKSPTVAVESILLTGAVDAKEGRDIMTNDVPNAFIQAHMPEYKNGEARVVMKVSGLLVKLLCELAPETYAPYVVIENGKKVLYLLVLSAIYGMLQAALI